MGFWEEVAYLVTGVDVPLGNAVFGHKLAPFGSDLRFALYLCLFTDLFHDLESGERFDSQLHKVYHDVVSAADTLAKGNSAFNKLVCVVKPDVCAVGKPRNANQVCNCLGLSVVQHIADKSRSEFGDSQSAVGADDLVVFYTQRLVGGKDAQNSRVVYGNVVHLYPRVVLKIAEDRWVVLSQKVEFQNVRVD